MHANAIEIRGLEKSFSKFKLGPLDLTVPTGAIYGASWDGSQWPFHSCCMIALSSEMVQHIHPGCDSWGTGGRAGSCNEEFHSFRGFRIHPYRDACPARI
jgi:hypothetical protein